MLTASLTPAPTPALTLAAPTLLPTLAPALVNAFDANHPFLRPRAVTTIDGFTYDYGDYSSCFNYDGLATCANFISSCSFDYQETDYSSLEAQATACYCTYGISYLNCYYSQIATGSCSSYYLGTTDFAEFQTDYYSEFCGSIPPSVMAQLKPPETVPLSFKSVTFVTARNPTRPIHTNSPLYSGSGSLLSGACTASTDFTLVDAGSTVFFAGFHGCNSDRPECCPWKVATASAAAATGSGSGGGGGGGTGSDTVNNVGVNFPVPADSAQAVLANCADDYYSISGGCCPNGYWPFTSAVGGQTPCYSSIRTTATPPNVTVGVPGNPTDTSKPTSAVVNIVWSMQFPVASSSSGSGGLSTAAKAGIGAGTAVAVILIGTLAFCLWRSHRKTKQLLTEKAAGQQQPPAPSGPAELHHQQAVPPGGQYAPGPYGAPVKQDPSVTASSVSALGPQHTGTSAGGISDNSSGIPGYYAGAVPPSHASYSPSNSNGTPGPPGNGQSYPPPIPEMNEANGQYVYNNPQYPYQQQPQQPQQFYNQSPPPGQQYYPPQQPQLVYSQEAGGYVHMQSPPQPQGGFAPQQQYPPQQYQNQGGQQVLYQPQPQAPPPQHMAEMSGTREPQPPQEVQGSSPQPQEAQHQAPPPQHPPQPQQHPPQ